MIALNLKDKHIILASKSPRRHRLLKELGIEFEIRTKDVDESFSDDIPPKEVAPYLAALKAQAFKSDLAPSDLLITADTTVVLNGEVINKPADRKDAIRMLNALSGSQHTVVTGVSLCTIDKSRTFAVTTDVYFRPLLQAEIEHYVDTFEPYDKAGSYGIQEWIGYIGIERLDGCFFNVMGLPLQRLYAELLEF